MEAIKKKSGAESGNDSGDGDKVNSRAMENGNGRSKVSKGNGVVQANGKENRSSDSGAFDVNKLQKLRAKGGKKTDTIVKDSKAEPTKRQRRTESGMIHLRSRNWISRILCVRMQMEIQQL